MHPFIGTPPRVTAPAPLRCRRTPLVVRVASIPVATDLVADSSTPKAVRKYLTKAGER